MAGENGAAYSVFGCVGRVEPFQVQVTETTGAGDEMRLRLAFCTDY
jgi:sugar/nucleoside kinase (ribokinase family)